MIGVGEEFPFFELNGVNGDKEIISVALMTMMGGRLFISIPKISHSSVLPRLQVLIVSMLMLT